MFDFGRKTVETTFKDKEEIACADLACKAGDESARLRDLLKEVLVSYDDSLGFIQNRGVRERLYRVVLNFGKRV